MEALKFVPYLALKMNCVAALLMRSHGTNNKKPQQFKPCGTKMSGLKDTNAPD